MAKITKEKKAAKAKRSGKQPTSSDNPNRESSSGRSKATIRRLRMYRDEGKMVRDRGGHAIAGGQYQSWLKSGTVVRVEPNRKWFGNTRVVTQQALQSFQQEMGKVKSDPYRVVMKRSRLPVSLLTERAKHVRSHLLETETFSSTFGPNARRKRPSLMNGVDSVAELADAAAERGENYDAGQDRALERDDGGDRAEARECIFSKGQSKRIWGELYKVVDASDVIVQVSAEHAKA